MTINKKITYIAQNPQGLQMLFFGLTFTRQFRLNFQQNSSLAFFAQL